VVPEHPYLVGSRCEEKPVVVGVPPPDPLVVLLGRIDPLTVAVACHPEVLEHEQAVFVARLIKLGTLGNSASPDSYQVEIHIALKAHLRFVTLAGKPKHRIGIDPVASFHEYLLSVYQQLATSRMPVPAGFNLSNADHDISPVDCDAANDKLERCFI